MLSSLQLTFNTHRSETPGIKAPVRPFGRRFARSAGFSIHFARIVGADVLTGIIRPRVSQYC